MPANPSSSPYCVSAVMSSTIRCWSVPSGQGTCEKSPNCIADLSVVDPTICCALLSHRLRITVCSRRKIPMNLADAQTFLSEHHRAVLATYRRDGSLQLSPISVGLDGEGRAIIS